MVNQMHPPSLSDRELAMMLQQQEAARHRDLIFDPEASSSSTSSNAWHSERQATPSGAATPRLARMALGGRRPAGGRRSQHPAYGNTPGCFGAMLGGVGGSVMAALGCAQMVCFCVAFGALAEQALRHGQDRSTGRRWSDTEPEENSSEETEDTPRGLDADAIERTTVVSTAGQKVSNGHAAASLGGGGIPGEDHCKCMICVELFCKGDSLRTLPCLHRYHRKCIDEWLRRSCQCPICKHDVTETMVPGSPRKVPPVLGSAVRRTLSGGFLPVVRLRRRLSRRHRSPNHAAASPASGSFPFRDALERTAR